MVSFQCDGCADTVKKPKLDQHRQRCWASFTCLDCSTTFQNQDYKSHTSCVSEAEKYQGALYKGPKKGGPQGAPGPTGNGNGQFNATRPQGNGRHSQGRKPMNQNNFTSAPPPDPNVEPTAPGIHPSRLTQISNTGGSNHPNISDYSLLRGNSRGRGRGGFARGGATRIAASGENGRAPEGGMRSWGSSPVPVTAPSTPPITPVPSTSQPIAAVPIAQTQVDGTDDGKKKKRKKGDKGGTGSKANSKRPKGEGDEAAAEPTSLTEEPQAKKRKRSASPAAAIVPSSAQSQEVSDKTVKRLRKNLAKTAENSPGESLVLSAWLDRIAEGKKERIDTAEISRAVKVTFEDGKWVLSL